MNRGSHTSLAAHSPVGTSEFGDITPPSYRDEDSRSGPEVSSDRADPRARPYRLRRQAGAAQDARDDDLAQLMAAGGRRDQPLHHPRAGLQRVHAVGSRAVRRAPGLDEAFAHELRQGSLESRLRFVELAGGFFSVRP